MRLARQPTTHSNSNLHPQWLDILHNNRHLYPPLPFPPPFSSTLLSPPFSLLSPPSTLLLVQVFSNGLSMRCQLPSLSSSPLVLLCLRALQACLPPETALQATLSYYRWRALQSCDRSCDEWAVFVKWLLSALGVQQQVKLPLIKVQWVFLWTLFEMLNSYIKA